jgi:hypothetical protein
MQQVVEIYHYALRDVPGEHISHLLCGGSLKSRKRQKVFKEGL